MVNSLKSVVNPDTLTDNMSRIHDFLRGSYQQAKEQLQDGVSFLKDELHGIQQKAGHYMNQMLLPVNNFLKDITQIESELQTELNKEPEQFVLLQGRLVTVEEVLTGPMEENY